eukprot:825705-Heterocapsa_arctica.AAC.1
MGRSCNASCEGGMHSIPLEALVYQFARRTVHSVPFASTATGRGADSRLREGTDTTDSQPRGCRE